VVLQYRFTSCDYSVSHLGYLSAHRLEFVLQRGLRTPQWTTDQPYLWSQGVFSFVISGSLEDSKARLPLGCVSPYEFHGPSHVVRFRGNSARLDGLAAAVLLDSVTFLIRIHCMALFVTEELALL